MRKASEISENLEKKEERSFEKAKSVKVKSKTFKAFTACQMMRSRVHLHVCVWLFVSTLYKVVR